MEDGLINSVIEKLNEPGNNNTATLITFFNQAFNTEFYQKQFQLFGKLIKMYGSMRVLNAILSAYDMENIRAENPYSILSYFCKKSLEKVQPTNFIDLSKLEKRHKKLKVGDPFSE